MTTPTHRKHITVQQAAVHIATYGEEPTDAECTRDHDPSWPHYQHSQCRACDPVGYAANGNGKHDAEVFPGSEF